MDFGDFRKSEKAGQVRGWATRQDPKGTGLSESTPLYGVTLDPKQRSQQAGASFMTTALQLAERSQSQVTLLKPPLLHEHHLFLCVPLSGAQILCAFEHNCLQLRCLTLSHSCNLLAITVGETAVVYI